MPRLSGPRLNSTYAGTGWSTKRAVCLQGLARPRLASTATRARKGRKTSSQFPQTHQNRHSSDEEARRGHVECDADKLVRVGEQVEEVALVELLEDVVQRPKRALHHSSQIMSLSGVASVLRVSSVNRQCVYAVGTTDAVQSFDLDGGLNTGFQLTCFIRY